jgi:hypothetical protein
MLEFSTNLRRQFAHQEIVLHLDKQSGLDPKWLVDFFQTSVAKGHRFLPNETVQIGWMVVILKENEKHDLEVWEPQFDSIPIRWIRGVNNTVRHLILQKSVAGLLQVEPVFPSLRQAGLVSRAFLIGKDEAEFHMIRESFEANYSGWRFSLPTLAEDSSELCSLFELSFHRTGIVPFLALPPGAVVVRSKNHIAIELNSITVESSSNELLQELAAVSIWV